MSRRSKSSDLDFGSDSFLDIIANIVGILIILIVVAGVKVSRQPIPEPDVVASERAAEPEEDADVVAKLDSDDYTSPPDATAITVPEQTQPFQMPAPVASTITPQIYPPEVAATFPVAAPSMPPVLPPLAVQEPDDLDENKFQPWMVVQQTPEISQPVVQPSTQPKAPALSPELLKHRDALGKNLATAASQLLAARREESRLRDLVAQSSKKLVNDSTVVAKLQRDIQQVEDAAQSTQQTVERNTLKLATLQGQLKTALKPHTQVKSIKHRLNPISHEVDKQEVHFRIAKGRLSIVPLDALLQEMKRHVQRRSDSLMRYNRHTGQIGPIGGYEMNYEIERQGLSTLDKLREGGNFVRIDVTEATVEPTDQVREMTAEEALRPGSEFSSHLHRIGPDASLTFWVYPDSFEAYRSIQSVMHDLGFAVAARPLPFGVPIGVSPGGSKSSAQ